MVQTQTGAGSDSDEVREKHRFNVKDLELFMEEHVEGFRGPLTISQFSGGQSCRIPFCHGRSAPASRPASQGQETNNGF